MCCQRTDQLLRRRPSHAPLEQNVSLALLVASQNLSQPHQLIDERLA